MNKKDKQKVIGEILSDEQLKTFLALEPADHTHPDYHILLRAYRALTAENFERFLPFFVEEGKNLQAPGPDQGTIADLIKQHKQSADYLKTLQTISLS